MVALIVDDQVSVVSGLFCGISWGKIGIEKVCKAYNAYEAKKIILSSKIDILLCDIEMPMESGLDLCSWLRENKYATLCIFLTAHADFMYAQKAVKLNVFDYVLQPAPYSEIEQVLARAVNKLRQQRISEEIYSYGKMIYSSREKFLDAVFHPVFTDPEYDIGREIDDIQKLDIGLSPDSQLYLSLIVSANAEKNKCGRQDIESVVKKYFTAENQNTVLFAAASGEYGCIVYPESDWLIPYDSYINQLKSVQSEITGKYGVDTAVYAGKDIQLSHIHEAADRILAYKNNMLEDICGLFEIDKIPPAAVSCPLPNMRVWQKMVQDGHPEIMITETEKFLTRLSSGPGGADMLKKFYQEYIQLIAVLLSDQKISINDLFDDKETMETILSSYKSVERMKKLVCYFSEYFSNEKNRVEDISLIKKIREYIEDNISEDLRREEIAEYVHLNPSYLSRIFRKETGKSLKEFITEKKMDLAQTLLKSTNLTISMIAAKTGYTNFSLFSQNYRKAKGKLPSEDRM